ncbi:MAG TPA: proline dehydrogenase [Croceibacterium sp.]
MTVPFKARLREARYALPGVLERHIAGETAEQAARSCARLARSGVAVTPGYFHGGEAEPAAVADTWRRLATSLAQAGCDALLALKAPALGFDGELVRSIAEAGVPLVFDSLTEPLAARTLELAELSSAGAALPARWRRSAGDAARLRDGSSRIRLIKGEWADPAGDPRDFAEAYLELAGILARRRATVGVATHDPVLAEATLNMLLDAGTPCELEQLRGLPRRRTMAVARKLGVRVRLYYPFGPGWWPYALDKALARPYLPLWALRDLIGA